MKLIIAVIKSNDEPALISSLNKNNFMVTKLASTGGFLKNRNVTLIIGTEKERVEEAIDLIKEICKVQDVTMGAFLQSDPSVGVVTPYSISERSGGATVFVVDVDQFLKV